MRRARRDPASSHQRAGSGLRRYRCLAEGCGWQGLLPRLSRARARSATHVLQRQARRWAWAGAALLALGLAAAAVVRQGLAPVPSLPRVPAGESHYGRPLPDAHPLQVRFDAVLAAAPAGQPIAALALRQQCAWGRPGGNPYRGTVEEALQAAGLPTEVVRSVAAQVRAGQPVERLQIGNDGIHAQRSGRVFNPHHMAMTYGRTLCLHTHVNFAEGHTEPASLYEATDASGRRHAVMVPDVCGNVTMISEGLARRERITTTGGSADVAWLLQVPDVDPRTTSSSGSVNTVPEPGTLWGVGAGLALMAWLRRRCRAAGATSGPKRP